MKPLLAAFIVNPESGGGHGCRIAKDLPRLLDHMGLSPSRYAIHSVGQEDPARLAKSLAHRAHRIIAMGGDGTVVSVINGVHQSGLKVPVGVIPLGTGNDLARTLGLYKTFQRRGLRGCLRGLLESEPVFLDLWRVNDDHVMVNYASIGLTARVIHRFHRLRMQRMVPLRSTFLNQCLYVLVGLYHVGSPILRDTHLGLRLKGKNHMLDLPRFRDLVLTNIQSYGGGSVLFSDVDYANGRLEILPVSNTLKLMGLFMFRLLPPPARLHAERMLPRYRAEWIELRVAPGTHLQIDGEDKTALLKESPTLRIDWCGQVSVIPAPASKP